MMKNIRWIMLAVICCFAFGSGQSVLEIGGGMTQLTGDGSEYFKTGFNINGNFFGKTSPTLFMGLHAAYNRVSVDEDEFLGGYTGLGVDISGSISIIELIPSIRIVPVPRPGQSARFFIQAGGGMYLMKGESEVSALGYSVSTETEENEFGIQLAAGMIFGAPGTTTLTVYPMYNIIFTEDESTKYFTVNLGIALGR
ncbi:hypothetical protein JW948_12015 [bacterium]|nr:hypothetical protein [bacterium]